MSTSYSLQIGGARDLVWHPGIFHSKVPSLYCKATLAGIVYRTSTIKNLTPVWDQRLSLLSSSPGTSSALNIQVKHNTRLGHNVCIAHTDIELNELLEKCEDGGVEINLQMPPGKRDPASAGLLRLCLETSTAMKNTKNGVTSARQAVKQSEIPKPSKTATVTDAVDRVTAHVSDNSDMYTAIGQLCKKMDKFIQVVDVVSAVHPYLSVAWQLSSFVYRAVSKQVKADQAFIELVHLMDDAFNFVNEADSTLREKCHSLENAIIGLLKQTSECCRFIQQYTTHGFIRRTIDSKNSEKIAEFKQVLSVLQVNVTSGVNLSVALVSARVSEKVDALFLDSRLRSSTTSSFNRPQCLAGTRIRILSRLVAWAQSTSDQNVFWLSGVAGSGKSTVSTTIANDMHEVARLGTFIAFERGKSDPDTVIQMIAHGLALFHSSIAKSLVETITQDGNVINASAQIQFDKLLSVPLHAASVEMNGPVVVVLDALDECGTPSSRKVLLQLIRDQCQSLPKCFRFLITSRPEADLSRVLANHPESVDVMELDYLSDTSQKDVLAYIRKEMHSVVRDAPDVYLPVDWKWDSNMELLAKAAGGLFIWASTAVKYVSESDDDRFWRLEKLVDGSQSLDLNELYTTVLESHISWNSPHSMSRFRRVLGLILFSKVPLSSSDIDGILGYPIERSSHSLLNGLRSVIDLTTDGSVRLFHASFADYLTAPERKDERWFIDEPTMKIFISERCFVTMKDKLRFNICELESSHVRNDEVSGLQTRIKEKIPKHLDYACRFWARHLVDVPFSSERLSQLKDFLYARLLYWLEVLSLHKELDSVVPALLEATRWSTMHDTEISAFLRDAQNLVSIFYRPMSESTPHVYLSAFSFSSPKSPVAAHYMKHISFLPQVNRIGHDQQSLFRIIAGHTDDVMSIALSSDGTRIVSGSADKTIRVWDTESGQIVVGCFEGHTDWVRSVAISSDDTRIISGSYDKTIRVWDVKSGQAVAGPFEGHTDWVMSVAISSDGTHVVSGSADKTLRVWDIASGQVVAGPFEGHTGKVNSVALSSDGTRIVSGSDDRTVRVWDVKSGQVVAGPFEGHTDWVMSVAISSNGTRVVSGSADQTIRVWDVASGQVVAGHFEGHTGTVFSVALSSDGTRVVSGSADKMIRVWNVESGQVITDPFEGHTNWVRCVALSSDGTRIVSGSDDRTIRVWDVANGRVVTGPFEGHTSYVRSVALSPDGTRIISGSDDKTIRVWNAESGQPVGEPFRGHTGEVNSVTISSDGTRVVSGSRDYTIRVWDAKNGQVVGRPLEGHTDWVGSVAISSDDTRIISGSYDKTIRVWDVKSGQIVAGPFEGHTDWVMSVALSSDGARVVSGSADKTIRVWDIESGQVVAGPFEGHTGKVNSVALSSDGTRIVSGSDDKTIRVWDVKSGQVVVSPFIGHTESVMSVALSSDGTRVVSGSYDKTVRVWDIESGQVVAGPFEGHIGWVRCVALSADGSRVVSGSIDKTIRVWSMPDSSLLATRCDDSRSSMCLHEGQPISNWKLYMSGWIKSGDALLLWVPLPFRLGLYRPENTVIMSCPSTTRIDFSGYAHGKDWHKCFKPF